MKNRKQLLADFYLDLLAMPVSTPNNNFANLRREVLLVLTRELESDLITVHGIFERMAAEESK